MFQQIKRLYGRGEDRNLKEKKKDVGNNQKMNPSSARIVFAT